MIDWLKVVHLAPEAKKIIIFLFLLWKPEAWTHINKTCHVAHLQIPQKPGLVQVAELYHIFNTFDRWRVHCSQLGTGFDHMLLPDQPNRLITKLPY